MASDTLKILAAITSDPRDLVTFVPKDSHRRAKANFWTTVQELGLPIPAEPDYSLALQHSGDAAIQRWWGEPGFRDWFWNRDELRQRVEMLLHQGLDTIQYLLLDEEGTASSKLESMKILLQMSNKMNPAPEAGDKFLDKKIAEMTRAQLEEYIGRSVRMLPPAAQPALDVESVPVVPKDK